MNERLICPCVVQHSRQIDTSIRNDEHRSMDVKLTGSNVLLSEKIIARITKIISQFLVETLKLKKKEFDH